MVVYFVGGVLIVAQVFDKDPQGILTAMGALTAVSMLVFKDTILGFVASIQLSANDMIRVGDWVSMPKYGADGDVIKITLNTVKFKIGIRQFLLFLPILLFPTPLKIGEEWQKPEGEE